MQNDCPDLPRRILMGPGPSEVHPRVLAALARPTLGHLDPAFIGVMDDIVRLLRYAFRTGNALTFPVSAPGSAGMECCFVNLLEPGDKVVVCANGVFGLRMKENVERCGAVPVMVEDPWGAAVDPRKVRAALEAVPGVKAVAFVHAETSTGVRSDAQALCALARTFGALSIVDTVTGLGGIAVDVDAWDADAVYAGSQKCLSCPPGLSPVTFGARAAAAVRARRTKVQSWFLDLSLIMDYWADGRSGGRAYHHTAPVNALYGLHEALVMLREEGLDAAWRRHARMHEALVTGLEAMGLHVRVDAAVRLPQITMAEIPGGRGRRGRARKASSGLQSGDWRRPRRVGRQGLAHRPHGAERCARPCADMPRRAGIRAAGRGRGRRAGARPSGGARHAGCVKTPNS